jgi:hypothetical protein
MSASRISKAIPNKTLIGALTAVNLGYAGYHYSQYNNREVGNAEQNKAQHCLDRLAGGGRNAHNRNLDAVVV